ncbi:MAG: hypothetical protein AAB403_03660 [Planctomycetota bacterium]
MDFIKWFVTSSADPLKFSLSIRGLLVIGGGWLLNASVLACGLGVYCLGVTDYSVNQAIELITQIAYALALFFGSVMAAWGFIRKLAYGRWSAA